MQHQQFNSGRVHGVLTDNFPLDVQEDDETEFGLAYTHKNGHAHLHGVLCLSRSEQSGIETPALLMTRIKAHMALSDTMIQFFYGGSLEESNVPRVSRVSKVSSQCVLQSLILCYTCLQPLFLYLFTEKKSKKSIQATEQVECEVSQISTCVAKCEYCLKEHNDNWTRR